MFQHLFRAKNWETVPNKKDSMTNVIGTIFRSWQWLRHNNTIKGKINEISKCKFEIRLIPNLKQLFSFLKVITWLNRIMTKIIDWLHIFRSLFNHRITKKLTWRGNKKLIVQVMIFSYMIFVNQRFIRCQEILRKHLENKVNL